MKHYVVLNKKVGQTPLSALETYRSEHSELLGVPMAYAGRLDPMAEGKLLVLIGDECKVQEKYHALDKEYEFQILFGVSSDTADVLGRLSFCELKQLNKKKINAVLKKYTGTITLPYPHFSSRPVQGKPLHVWKLEGKIHEIDIPTKTSTVYTLTLKDLYTVSVQEAYVYATEKIETIPEVTDERKKLGADFRRTDVRADWKKFLEVHDPESQLYVATLTCICSSGTYMRTLAEVIAKDLGTCGLAYSIHRTEIGVYTPLLFGFGLWSKKYL